MPEEEQPPQETEQDLPSHKEMPSTEKQHEGCPFEKGPRPSESCPLDLKGPFEFPHLIIPVSQHAPDVPQGNSLNGTLAPGICSIFTFDVHPEHAGKQCGLMFLLPELRNLETSSYVLRGSGSLVFFGLEGDDVDKDTTWNNKPKGHPFYIGPTAVRPGMKIDVAQAGCKAAAGRRVAIQVCSDGDLELSYFQDFNPEPIGLYMRVC
jgi:hypothetical protein